MKKVSVTIKPKVKIHSLSVFILMTSFLAVVYIGILTYQALLPAAVLNVEKTVSFDTSCFEGCSEYPGDSFVIEKEGCSDTVACTKDGLITTIKTPGQPDQTFTDSCETGKAWGKWYDCDGNRVVAHNSGSALFPCKNGCLNGNCLNSLCQHMSAVGSMNDIFPSKSSGKSSYDGNIKIVFVPSGWKTEELPDYIRQVGRIVQNYLSPDIKVFKSNKIDFFVVTRPSYETIGDYFGAFIDIIGPIEQLIYNYLGWDIDVMSGTAHTNNTIFTGIWGTLTHLFNGAYCVYNIPGFASSFGIGDNILTAIGQNLSFCWTDAAATAAVESCYPEVKFDKNTQMIILQKSQLPKTTDFGNSTLNFSANVWTGDPGETDVSKYFRVDVDTPIMTGTNDDASIASHYAINSTMNYFFKLNDAYYGDRDNPYKTIPDYTNFDPLGLIGTVRNQSLYTWSFTGMSCDMGFDLSKAFGVADNDKIVSAGPLIKCLDRITQCSVQDITQPCKKYLVDTANKCLDFSSDDPLGDIMFSGYGTTASNCFFGEVINKCRDLPGITLPSLTVDDSLCINNVGDLATSTPGFFDDIASNNTKQNFILTKINGMLKYCHLSTCDRWNDLVGYNEATDCNYGYCALGLSAVPDTNDILTSLSSPYKLDPAYQRIACCAHKKLVGEYQPFCLTNFPASKKYSSIDDYCNNAPGVQDFINNPMATKMQVVSFTNVHNILNLFKSSANSPFTDLIVDVLNENINIFDEAYNQFIMPDLYFELYNFGTTTIQGFLTHYWFSSSVPIGPADNHCSDVEVQENIGDLAGTKPLQITIDNSLTPICTVIEKIGINVGKEVKKFDLWFK